MRNCGRRKKVENAVISQRGQVTRGDAGGVSKVSATVPESLGKGKRVRFAPGTVGSLARSKISSRKEQEDSEESEARM